MADDCNLTNQFTLQLPKHHIKTNYNFSPRLVRAFNFLQLHQQLNNYTRFLRSSPVLLFTSLWAIKTIEKRYVVLPNEPQRFKTRTCCYEEPNNLLGLNVTKIPQTVTSSTCHDVRPVTNSVTLQNSNFLTLMISEPISFFLN